MQLKPRVSWTFSNPNQHFQIGQKLLPFCISRQGSPVQLAPRSPPFRQSTGWKTRAFKEKAGSAQCTPSHEESPIAKPSPVYPTKGFTAGQALGKGLRGTSKTGKLLVVRCPAEKVPKATLWGRGNASPFANVVRRVQQLLQHRQLGCCSKQKLFGASAAFPKTKI